MPLLVLTNTLTVPMLALTNIHVPSRLKLLHRTLLVVASYDSNA